jgi:hypothetical protein
VDWVKDFPGTGMETLDLVFQEAFQVVVTVIVCNPFVSKLCFIFPSGKPTPASVVLITVPSENLQVQVGDAVRVTGIPVTTTDFGPKKFG